MGDLRLRAADADDLCVIAAVLQDARAPLNEMVFSPAEGRFMAAFTRRRRELGAEATATCLSVLRLDGVQAVRWRGLSPGRPEAEHVVLTLMAESPEHLLLIFQAGEAIRFEVEGIDVHLEDFVPGRRPAARSGGERSLA